MRGWEFTGRVPDFPKLIALGVPHTSNWDFVVFLAILHHFKIKMSFIGKHTLFRWPFGFLFRRWGGIPVDRSKPRGLVSQVVEAINDAPTMMLAVAPEATRQPAPYWKAGFIRIAQEAGVPVVLSYVDYSTKTTGFGPTIEDLSDTAAMMDEARSFYANKEGRYPDQKGPVRLRNESR